MKSFLACEVSSYAHSETQLSNIHSELAITPYLVTGNGGMEGEKKKLTLPPLVYFHFDDKVSRGKVSILVAPKL